jgi:hypothetical protein
MLDNFVPNLWSSRGWCEQWAHSLQAELVSTQSAQHDCGAESVDLDQIMLVAKDALCVTAAIAEVWGVASDELVAAQLLTSRALAEADGLRRKQARGRADATKAESLALCDGLSDTRGLRGCLPPVPPCCGSSAVNIRSLEMSHIARNCVIERAQAAQGLSISLDRWCVGADTSLGRTRWGV